MDFNDEIFFDNHIPDFSERGGIAPCTEKNSMKFIILNVIRKTTNINIKKGDYQQHSPDLQIQSSKNSLKSLRASCQFSRLIQYFTLGVSTSPCISPASFNSFKCWETVALAMGSSS